MFKYLIPFIIIFCCRNIYANSPIQIITTVPYIQDLVKNVTCFSNQFQVQSIIPAGVDPHTFILSPNDRINLHSAHIIYEIGIGLEPWLDKLNLQNVYNIGAQLQLNKINPNEKNNSHFSYDPHIWQSPEITKQAVHIILNSIVKIDPVNQKKYELCAETYTNKINIAVDKINKLFSVLPFEKRILATNHDALGYFAKAFHFKIQALLGLSDDEEPTIQQFQIMIENLKQDNMNAIFLESTGNSKNILTLSKNAHVKIGGQLFGDSFGIPSSGADTTIGLWTTNANTILKALK